MGRVALVAVVAVCALTGCFGPRSVEVRADAGAAHLNVGERLRVRLGAVNPSVGDSWHLTGGPDVAVLTDSGQDFSSDCDAPGCGGTLHWTFTAAGRGTTTLVFQYCYRSRPPDCQPQPTSDAVDPVTLNVTVA